MKSIDVGIGFATGRRHFLKVLKTHTYNLTESGLVENNQINLNLLVAYDLDYQKTKLADYTHIPAETASKLNEMLFIGNAEIRTEVADLIRKEVIDERQAALLFGKGYAAKRNAILYFALKDKMDYLIFLDDDEYPIAVTNFRNEAIWIGQHVLLTHLKYITQADITHGHHCGYISPIPYVEFDDVLSEDDFRIFIESISNDIIEWPKIKALMNDGGVTYADMQMLVRDDVVEVQEQNHAKFISGANLCLNLTDPNRVFPFYNPPGARGEDTFLSTCLHDRTVLKVPCYTFHDGFSTYNHLLDGVLPVRLKYIRGDEHRIIGRFYRACIGWIRYKPLFLHITQPGAYPDRIREIRSRLVETLPKVSSFFDFPDFQNMLPELDKYHRNVERHEAEFLESKKAWANIMHHLARS